MIVPESARRRERHQRASMDVMSTRAVWTIGTLLLVFGLLALVACRPDREGVEKNDGESGAVEEELARLPHELVIHGRTIVFDSESVEAESRDEYARLPYEVEIGDETRRVEADIAMESDEAPVEFIERFIEGGMPPEEELDMYPETMYQYTVSLHQMERNSTAGISAYVRSMNFPDDAIGGNEHRFDSSVRADDTWSLLWHGERMYCRRPGREFWQPADQLCP